MRKTLLFCTITMTLLVGCAGGGLFEKEKKYTPLHVYYSPLQPDLSLLAEDNFSPSVNYPYFVNYPNDRMKHGLRGNVAAVQYSYPSSSSIKAILTFDRSGKITSDGMYNFVYDAVGRLEGRKKAHFSLERQCEYDAQGRLTKLRTNPYLGVECHTCSYYDDRTVKSITPTIGKDSTDYYHLCHIGTMVFNEAGEWIKAEIPRTANFFYQQIRRRTRLFDRLPSTCTFTYNTDGLCTEKEETVSVIQNGEFILSHPNIEYYEYNDKGDLSSWEYQGLVWFESSGQFNSFMNNVRVTFDYDYDRHGNWTTMRIMLPDNYANIPILSDYYRMRLRTGQISSGEKPVVTIKRQIEYYAFSAEEERELKKKDAPKFTAVQGYGLYGDVKSVSDSRFVILFDEYGNITKRTWIDYGETNEFSYESSTRYMRSGVGPFRITCEGNLRKEEDEGKIMGTEEYEFDKKGRVVRHDYADANGMCPINETYTYNGREKFPVTMVYKYSYEEGQDVATCKYTYIETDKQGNWTKRKVNRTWECVEYFFDGEKDTSRTMTKTDPEFTETRTISYY